MHFSKTYAKLLLNLPPEFQENAIQYRQLKKIINQIVQELSSHGLDPPLLHQLLETRDNQPLASSSNNHGSSSVTACLPDIRLDSDTTAAYSPITGAGFPKVIYEFDDDTSKIDPRLRITFNSPGKLGNLLQDGAKGKQKMNNSETSSFDDESTGVCNSTDDLEGSIPPGTSLLWTLQKGGSDPHALHPSSASGDIIIPLVSDRQFFELLGTALESIADNLQAVRDEFLQTLTTLSDTIASSARPASSSRSVLGGFHPHSPLSDHPGSIQAVGAKLPKSDLYSWREIFQLYTEAEVFESVHERNRGEHTIEESERRLQLFSEQVTRRGSAARGKFKLKESRAALETFLQLNIYILNIKKFQLANSEAARKILKKHTKRTALPLPGDAYPSNVSPQLALVYKESFSLPRVLVQAIGETLLPIIPHIDDYSCLICTNLAFKPIRLNCGHLFCVRCLVKLQKLGSGDCPVCRAPSVSVANRSNVDWALMNFMQDWFPTEAKVKSRANEREAVAEELRELGLDPDARCLIM